MDGKYLFSLVYFSDMDSKMDEKDRTNTEPDSENKVKESSLELE